MNGDVSVSIDPSLIYYVEERIKGWFGQDQSTSEWNNRLSRRMKLALEQASWVQCVGMDQPVPITSIYQPIGLSAAPSSRRSNFVKTDITRLMTAVFPPNNEVGTDAVIYAGPGRGKSTLVNRLFLDLQSDTEFCPFLFILRTESCIEDLREFVERLSKKAPNKKGPMLILFVDGYDEISEDERHKVSQILMEFRSRRLGRFYLTCRTYYDVYDLKVPAYYLSSFEEHDVRKFVSSFANCYDVRIDVEELISGLRARDLWEFARHPLMLTLICILKTGPLPELPHRSLDLLARAFDTLTLRWDQQRGIHRHSTIPIDGYDRIAILKKVAFQMRSLIVSQESLEVYVRQHLRLIQRRHIDARSVLQEIAQWFGVLVTAGDGRWQFIHRSIHDYLAARHWVESGRFNPDRVEKWDYRSAYAAYLTGDATTSMVRALRSTENIQMFTECLYNNAPFDTEKVADAVLEHFARYRPFTHHRSRAWLTVETSQDFFSLCSDQFLSDLLAASIRHGPSMGPGSESLRYAPHDVLAVYVLGEIKSRGRRLVDEETIRCLQLVFDETSFRFQIGIEKPELFQMSDLVRS